MSNNLCPLADPVFDRNYNYVCAGSVKVYSILPIPGAEQYEWTLPEGTSQLEDGKTGVILTTNPWINVSIDKAGTINSIQVRAISSKQPSSMTVPSGAITSEDVTPVITVAPQATCSGDTGVVLMRKNPNFNYSTSISGAAWIDSSRSDSIVVVWGSNPTGTVSVTAGTNSGCSVTRNFPIDLSGGETVITCPADIKETIQMDTAVAMYSYTLNDTLRPVITSKCGYGNVFNDYDTSRAAISGTIDVQMPTSGSKTEKDIRWSVVARTGDTLSCTFKLTLEVNMALAPYTAFSPNGDGKNDYWDVGNIEYYQGAVVRVFDRWGQLVFECKGNCNDRKWDGRNLKGEPMAFDTYHYTITHKDKVIKVGYVTLIK
jgi:gliding motility-associated-like protein